MIVAAKLCGKVEGIERLVRFQMPQTTLAGTFKMFVQDDAWPDAQTLHFLYLGLRSQVLML